jgi:probable rRNA maturation factor
MSNKLSLMVQYASELPDLPTRAQFRRWINAALQRDVNVTLRIVDEPEGLELNRSYRGKDYATNVLTFVYEDCSGQPLPVGSDVLCGDVVICAPVVEREAAAQHKTLRAHYAHLAIHATLHLQGYDHDDDAQAAEMETLETALMLKLGYSDPYQAS